AIAVQAEMADEASILNLYRTVDETLGPVTALVNNAGTPGPMGKIDTVTAAVLDEVLAVNVRAPFLLIREAVARMATDRGGAGGAIVNVSSRAAELGGAGEWIHYAASKGALDSLTVGASKELAQRGIRVNAVSPGLIQTDLHARAGLPDRLTRLVGGVPMGRVGSTDEVANAVLWLLSPEASYITGVTVPISGGRWNGYENRIDRRRRARPERLAGPAVRQTWLAGRPGFARSRQAAEVGQGDRRRHL